MKLFKGLKFEKKGNLIITLLDKVSNDTWKVSIDVFEKEMLETKILSMFNFQCLKVECL